MITAAPYGPIWMPADYPEDIPVTWDEQTQKAVDCYNAGASVLHIHVRDPKTGHISKNLQDYSDQIGRLREAVPDMVLQVGGSISFAPEGDQAATWQSYDTRHMLAEIDPKPDQVTVALGSTTYDMTPLLCPDDFKGTTMENNPKVFWQYAQMVADATPEFYLEHLKRLSANKIQPYFSLAHIHSLMILERLVRQGVYKGPVNGFYSMIGGGVQGTNPYDFMETVRRNPHGSCFTYHTVMRHSWALAAMCIALGLHTRTGIEENLWGVKKGEKMTTVEMVEKHVRMANELGRDIATGKDAQRMLKIGTWYESADDTLFHLGLPPNRTDGQRGFLTYETDGRLPQTPAFDDHDPRLML